MYSINDVNDILEMNNNKILSQIKSLDRCQPFGNMMIVTPKEYQDNCRDDNWIRYDDVVQIIKCIRAL